MPAAMLATRTLEFDRVVERVTALALTPLGSAALARLTPSTDPEEVLRAQAGTTETTAYLDRHPLFALRAPDSLPGALAGLAAVGRPLEPLQLRGLAGFLDSMADTRAAILKTGAAFPILSRLAARVASFADETAAVRRSIDEGGEVLDGASPELKRLRGELRQQRQRLRDALERFTRGRERAKYLQDEVVTERNGRFVLMVRAEHRAHVPGIVHGSSASGATLFLEPAETVALNNDIVEAEEREREEILRILIALTDLFRHRGAELATASEVAIELDVLQAKARYGAGVNGIEPVFTADASLDLAAARHPLLVSRTGPGDGTGDGVVPVDIRLDSPTRVLLITGPNTGGKTVALKTAGLLALMAQAGLHVPAARARLPVFRGVFADIGDEQSIAASLSTFSAHIANLVSMDRALALPSLVLLDEVGTGTDPNEGGALATAIVQHFRDRGALVVATTHFDAVKTWGVGTDGVAVAAFAFDPRTFAPTYRLVYGAPGRSLAIEIAQRLGLPAPLVAAARGLLGDDQKRLQAHLARIDAQARALESDRARLDRDRRALDEASAALADRDRAIAAREDAFKKRLNDRLDDRIRQARREIDQVIDRLRQQSDALVEKAGLRAAVSTGDVGEARAEARTAIDRIVEGLRHPAEGSPGAGAARARDVERDSGEVPGAPEVGARVAVGALGIEGTVVSIDGGHADIDVRGKRVRARVKELRVVAGPRPSGAAGDRQAARVRVNVDLGPREGSLSELNVIGLTVDEAVDRVAKFLDQVMVTDVQQVRIVHGHGTGQLRRGLHAYLKDHPLVRKYHAAPDSQGGGGATLVDLNE